MSDRYVVWTHEGDIRAWVKDTKDGALLTTGKCAQLLNDREAAIAQARAEELERAVTIIGAQSGLYITEKNRMINAIRSGK